MLLIPDNTTLRSFIPNSFSPLPDSQSLFDKITPFLQSAEIWFKSEFIPENLLLGIISEAQQQDDPLYFLPRRIVAMRAWQNAIPAIDIVVGNNGVGVVETATLKPASKAKIDNLLLSVASELDRNIEMLLPLLPTINGWIGSAQAEKFRATLFPTFWILRRLGFDDDLWNRWLRISQRIRTIEDEIGEQWISTPVLHRLRIINMRIVAGSWDFGLPDNVAHIEDVSLMVWKLISSVQHAVGLIIGAEQEGRDTQYLAKPYLEKANAIIRNNPAIFPEWEDSPTARFFKTPAFRNSPGSTAFYF
jgi:hypothetical protein